MRHRVRWFIPIFIIGVLAFLCFPLNIWSDASDKNNPSPIPVAPAEYLSMKNKFTSAADIKKGESLYQGKCSDCHGEKGEGDGEEAVVFNNAKYMKNRVDGQLFYIIREGAGEDEEMEAYGVGSDAGLSDKKIWQIIAYIRTLAK